MTNFLHLSADQLRAAANIKDKIEGLMTELTHLVGFSNLFKATPEAPKPERKKNKMSAAGRAKIAAAQKARWSKVKAAKSMVKAKPAPKAKKKSNMSAAGRAKIAAAQKARWAKVKQAEKNTL